MKMTIDEAIRHCKETAMSENIECNECRSEHEQLAEWLEELKAWKTDPFKMIHDECAKYESCDCEWVESCEVFRGNGEDIAPAYWDVIEDTKEPDNEV